MQTFVLFIYIYIFACIMRIFRVLCAHGKPLGHKVLKTWARRKKMGQCFFFCLNIHSHFDCFCNHSYFNIRLNCYILRLLEVFWFVSHFTYFTLIVLNSILYVDHVIITCAIHDLLVIFMKRFVVFVCSTDMFLRSLYCHRRRSDAELLSIYYHHFVYVILKVNRIKIIRRKNQQINKRI